jgi:hypothetical protein
MAKAKDYAFLKTFSTSFLERRRYNDLAVCGLEIATIILWKMWSNHDIYSAVSTTQSEKRIPEDSL